MIAKNHSEKTINEPWIRHDLKYTQLHGCNQPIKGNSHNQHTHHHYEASRNRNRFGKRYEHDKRMITTPSSPLPDTRGGAGKRDERGSEMSGTGGEPQSAEASTSRQPHDRSPRMIRHRHAHDDSAPSKQVERERANHPAPPHDTSRAGSNTRRNCDLCRFCDAIKLYICFPFPVLFYKCRKGTDERNPQ